MVPGFLSAVNSSSSPLVSATPVALVCRIVNRTRQADLSITKTDGSGSYTLTVDAEGKPVGCSFSRDFRMLVTERDVCRSFLRSVTFEPARDAQGNPVIGTYEGEIEIASFFQPSR